MFNIILLMQRTFVPFSFYLFQQTKWSDGGGRLYCFILYTWCIVTNLIEQKISNANQPNSFYETNTITVSPIHTKDQLQFCMAKILMMGSPRRRSAKLISIFVLCATRSYLIWLCFIALNFKEYEKFVSQWPALPKVRSCSLALYLFC